MCGAGSSIDAQLISPRTVFLDSYLNYRLPQVATIRESLQLPNTSVTNPRLKLPQEVVPIS